MALETKIFGCKTNKFYAEKWLQSGELNNAHGVFVVSCVVTDQAKSRWIKFILKLLETNTLTEEERVYLSGCGTIQDGKLDPKFWDKYPQLIPHRNRIVPLGQDPHTVPGLKKTLGLQSGLQEKLQKLQKQQNLYTRKHIVIQTGCDTFCTFCATIHARGRHKNRPMEEIISEIQTYESQGGKEIVITGINLGAWGADSTIQLQDSKFPDLLESILEQTSIPRIRISSTGVEFVSPKLMQLYEERRVNPHIHLSIQSASDTILKRMNRKYDRDTLLHVMRELQNIKRHDEVDVSIGADMIVGFPGETDADHADSVALIEDFHITKLHAFPFSAHVSAHSVPAAKLKDQVDQNTKYVRLREMLAAGERERERFIRKNQNKPLQLLVEKVDGDTFSGWSENYIHLDESNFDIGSQTIQRNTIISGTLIGKEKKSDAEEKPSII